MRIEGLAGAGIGAALCLAWLGLLAADARLLAEGKLGAGLALAFVRLLLVAGVLVGVARFGGAAALVGALVGFVAVRTIALRRVVAP